MKVRAKKDGFCGKFRKAGDIFDYDGEELGSWMEDLRDEPKDESKKQKPKSHKS